MAIVKRADRQHYMNTGTAAEPVWSRIGEGFTEFAESKNAVSYQRRYINESTKRTDVTGYAPVIDYEFEVYTDNPVIEKLRRISDAELVGEDAKVELLTVDLFDEEENWGRYRAYRRIWSVIPDESGKGADALVYTGTMKGVGDIEEGVYIPSSGVYTADA